MVRKLLIALAATFSILALIIFTRPTEYRVERKELIAAPPVILAPLVSDLARWSEWNPGWSDAKLTCAGPTQGVGVKCRWSAGTVTITDARPDFVGLTFDYLTPEPGTNRAELTWTPTGPGTLVTWRVMGTSSLSERAMRVVMDYERIIGTDLEKALSGLKYAAESKVPTDTGTPDAGAP